MSSGVVNQGGGVLEQAAKEISSAQSDLASIASNLSGQIEPVAASWKGAGGTAFFSFHQAWQEKERKIVDILNNFASAIGATHTTTTAVDTDESSTYKNIAGRLG